MSSISISVYVIRVVETKELGRQQIDNYDGEGADLLPIIAEYLEGAVADSLKNEHTKKVANIHEYEINGRLLHGVIRTGEYGYTSDIVDVDTGETNYEKGTEEAALIPYYFSMWLPEGHDEGILLLQNFKQFGITGAFREIVLKHFNRTHCNYRLNINPLVPEQAVLNFLNDGRIIKARFIEYGLPADQAEAIGHAHAERNINVEYSLTAKKGSEVPFRERILNFLNGSMEPAEMLELENFEYDDIKIEVDVNGKPKTINLFDLKKMRPRFDISDQVEIGSTGHPLIDSVHDEAQNILRYIATTIGIEDDL